MRERLEAMAGIHPQPTRQFNFASLQTTEWSDDFERLMRNRLIMGCLRYGPMVWKKKNGNKWDLLGAINKKVGLYVKTGNTEYLVDAANYLLLEFECGEHPNKHFNALDDHSDHCKLKRYEGRT